MADLTILTHPDLVRAGIVRSSDLKAGEVLDAGSACYVSDAGTVWMSLTVKGTAIPLVDDVLASFGGICLEARAIGQPVTLFGLGTVVRITSDTLTPGAFIYPSETAGALSDADISLNGEMPICKAFDTECIEVVVTHGDLVS